MRTGTGSLLSHFRAGRMRLLRLRFDGITAFMPSALAVSRMALLS
jgi:hypothetical protein